MSNRPVLRFNRSLRGVRDVDGKVDGRPTVQPALEQVELEGHRRQIEEQREELKKKEAELAERKDRLARKEQGLEEKLAQMGALLVSLQEERAQMLESNEEEIVAFSLSITQKVLQHEIEHGHYKMTEVVKSALQAVRDTGTVVVRVNPRDHDMTRTAVEKMAQTHGRTGIKTVPDECIPLASCCIETDCGKIFSEIPGRLEKIEKSLLKSNGNANGI